MLKALEKILPKDELEKEIEEATEFFLREEPFCHTRERARKIAIGYLFSEYIMKPMAEKAEERQMKRIMDGRV